MYKAAFILLFTLQAAFAQKAVHTAYFEHDSISLTKTEEQKLRAFVLGLDTLTVQSISIKAFCDDTGSNWYNDILSYKRAYMLYHYFSEDKRVAFKAMAKYLSRKQPKTSLKKENATEERKLRFYTQLPPMKRL